MVGIDRFKILDEESVRTARAVCTLLTLRVENACNPIESASLKLPSLIPTLSSLSSFAV